MEGVICGVRVVRRPRALEESVVWGGASALDTGGRDPGEQTAQGVPVTDVWGENGPQHRVQNPGMCDLVAVTSSSERHGPWPLTLTHGGWRRTPALSSGAGCGMWGQVGACSGKQAR